MRNAPIIHAHEGVNVVRDDLLPGGTKSRYFAGLFDKHDHVVYASPAEGGAQTALAWAAREAGKRCTIFVAKRKIPHPRALAAKRLGATVVQVEHGYLNVVQSKAATFCQRTGAYNLPFGGAILSAEERIADAARSLGVEPVDVWCASGSGTLAKGLMRAWPNSHHHVVRVGRELPDFLGRPRSFTIHEVKLPFQKASRAPCPFPADPHYDRKAWAALREHYAGETVPSGTFMWNVAGPADDIEP